METKKKRFIVLVNFSEESKDLLKYAHDWGKQIGAELLVVHNLDLILSARIDDAIREDIEKQAISDAEDNLKLFCHETLPEVGDIHYMATQYSLHTAINQLSSDGYEQLVFVGEKAADPFKKILMGSTAIEVIENTGHIVVAIPKGLSEFRPQKIYVAIKKEYPLNTDALNTLLDSLGEPRPQVHFFSLLNKEEDTGEIESLLGNLTQQFSPKYQTGFSIHTGGDSMTAIKDAVKDHTSELLVVQKGARLLVDQLFRKFMVNELIYEGQTPLVVLP